MVANERRAFQRLKLAKPLLASIDGRTALVLDIGLSGAFVEHRGPAVPGLRVRLSFKWQGADITLEAEVVRSAVIRSEGADGVVSQSGLSFTQGVGDAEERLQQMMSTFVSHLLAAQRANAAAEPGVRASAILTQIGEARRARSHGLTRYRWDGIRWTQEPTDSTAQPADGFTVAAYEDEEELATLCEAYEISDDEGRGLIRMVAELSARNAR